MLGTGLLVPMGIALSGAVWWRGAGRVSSARLATRFVLVFYLTWLAGQAFFPIPLGAEAGPEAGSLASHVRLLPLSSVSELIGHGAQWQSLRVLLGNNLLFVPLGLLLPVAWPATASWHRMVLAGLATGLAIEAVQLLLSIAAPFPYRYVETDDVLLNLSGVLTGYFLRTAGARLACMTVARCRVRC
jgi:glycopeptide antibiotics resistance protein